MPNDSSSQYVRHGSCNLRWRCLPWPTSYLHPHRCHCWSGLRLHLWLPHLPVCKSDQYVSFPWVFPHFLKTQRSLPALTIFLIVMTNFLLLIGAGLFSRAVAAFEENAFNHLLGSDVDDAGGSGPGSYRVQGNVWHLDCCNPNDNLNGQG